MNYGDGGTGIHREYTPEHVGGMRQVSDLQQQISELRGQPVSFRDAWVYIVLVNVFLIATDFAYLLWNILHALLFLLLIRSVQVKTRFLCCLSGTPGFCCVFSLD